MRVSPILRLPPTIFEILPRTWKHPPKTHSLQPFPHVTRPQIAHSRPLAMSSSDSPNFSEYGIETTTINAAPGVSLSSHQKLLTGCVLDLFAGKPSKRKLTLWTDNGTFTDPITIATGRGQYEAQWYGLKTAFSAIDRLHAQVTSAGNPIEMDLKNKYTVAGIGASQTIDSKVLIHTSADGSKIEKVEDKWNGSLPDGAFANVSLLSPKSWMYYGSSWTYWLWRNYVVEFRVAGRRPWDAMRNLNSVVVPMAIKVPKSVEEEEKSQK